MKPRLIRSSLAAAGRMARSDSARLLVLLLLVNALVLLPVLDSGYHADDAFNSLARGHAIRTGYGPAASALELIKGMAKYNARFLPFSSYFYFLFYFATSLFWYKVFLLAAALWSYASLFFLLRELTGDARASTYALLVMPLFVQFRYVFGWDPVLAFNGLLPITSGVLFWSLRRYVRFLDARERRNLVLAAAGFVTLGLMYESSYTMAVVFVMLALIKAGDLKTALRLSWPFIAATAAFAALTLALRSSVALNPNNPYAPNLSLGPVIGTYLIHLLAGLPFSYWLFDPDSVFRNAFMGNSYGLWGFAAVTAVCVALAAHQVVSRVPAAPVPSCRRFTPGAVVALLLTVGALSPLLISLSPKYQQLRAGAAYLPVFLVSVCFAGGLGVALDRIAERAGGWSPGLRRAARPAVLAGWAILCGIAVRNNVIVVRGSDETRSDARRVLEAALSRGLADGIAPQTELLVEGVSFNNWNTGDFYAQELGFAVPVYNLGEERDYSAFFRAKGASCHEEPGGEICDFPVHSRILFVKARHVGRSFGYAVLTPVKRAFVKGNKVLGLLAQRGRMFFLMPPSVLEPPAAAIAGTEFPADGYRGGASQFLLSEELLPAVRRGSGWRLAEFARAGLFDALSVSGWISKEESASATAIPRPSNEYVLHAAGRELLHVAYSAGHLGAGVPLPAIAAGDSLSVELLFRPGADQVGFATILDNRDFEKSTGLNVEQVGETPGKYQAQIGTGAKFAVVGVFDAPAGVRSHVAIRIDRGTAALVVNGAIVARQVPLGAVPASRSPVILGNWPYGSRPFNGAVEEVMVYKEAKDLAALARESGKLAGNQATEFRVDWKGCYDEEQYPDNITLRWCSHKGELGLTNPFDRPIKVGLSMSIYTNTAAAYRVAMEGCGISNAFFVNRDGKPVDLVVSVNPGRSRIELQSDAPQLISNDGRELHFRIMNFHATLR